DDPLAPGRHHGPLDALTNQKNGVAAAVYRRPPNAPLGQVRLQAALLTVIGRQGKRERSSGHFPAVQRFSVPFTLKSHGRTAPGRSSPCRGKGNATTGAPPEHPGEARMGTWGKENSHLSASNRRVRPTSTRPDPPRREILCRPAVLHFPSTAP